MASLTQRAASGLCAALLVLTWISLAYYYTQPWAIALLLAIVTLWTSLEYVELAQKSAASVASVDFVVPSLLIILGYALPGETYGSLALAGAIGWLILRYLPVSESLLTLWSSIVGVLYLPYLLHFYYPIYRGPDGLGYSLLLLGLVWGYDIGAYIVGILWGKHKFYPALSPSPQKSWEGIIGGFLSSLMVGLASKLWIAWPASTVDFLLQVIPLVLLISGGVQLGDFFESKLKRAAGVKDAGKLFPGHGGLLDRIDGLLFALPLFYGYLRYVLHWL